MRVRVNSVQDYRMKLRDWMQHTWRTHHHKLDALEQQCATISPVLIQDRLNDRIRARNQIQHAHTRRLTTRETDQLREQVTKELVEANRVSLMPYFTFTYKTRYSTGNIRLRLDLLPVRHKKLFRRAITA